MEIPIINLKSAENGDQSLEVAKGIGKACIEYGFFYVINHGIENDLLKKVVEKLWQFFQLPLEKKNEIHRGDGYRGYFKKEEEHSIVYESAEWKEGIYYFCEFRHGLRGTEEVFGGSNPWPKEEYTPEFQRVLLDYFKKTQELAVYLLRCMAVSLGTEHVILFVFLLYSLKIE